MAEATHIRSCHPYAYHSGEWARILTIAPAPMDELSAYVIEFENGDRDFWPVEDPAAEYEFRHG